MQHHIRIASRLAHLLDENFKVGGFRFGLDPVMGLVPGIGDVAPFALSLYIIWIGTQMDLPQEKVAQMLANSLLDLVIGFVPLVGDIGDFTFKSNTKNLKILQDHLVSRERGLMYS